MPPADDDAPVPRLPRGRMLKLSGPALVRILLTLSTLVMVVVIQRPCANNVSRFVTSFGSGSADSAGSGSGAAPVELRPKDYERITADMTPDEVKAAMARARAKAAQAGTSSPGSAASAAGSGSAGSGSAGSGSAGSGAAATSGAAGAGSAAP